MGLGRDTRNRIIAVSHFSSRIGSDQDYHKFDYQPADVDGEDYSAISDTDIQPDDGGFRLRGMTERKKRQGSLATPDPRPAPSYQYPSSSAGGPNSYQGPYYSAPSATPAAYYQSPVQHPLPPMNNGGSGAYIPPNQQFPNGNPSQGYVNPNASHYHHHQGTQQQHHQYQQHQHPQPQQQYNPGYHQGYNQHNAYGVLPKLTDTRSFRMMD